MPSATDHQPTGQFRLGRLQLHLADRGALFLVFLPQGVQVAQPLLVALAPGGDAVAEPVLLHDDLAAELVALGFLLLQDLVAPGFEVGEALVEHAGDAAVQPDGGA